MAKRRRRTTTKRRRRTGTMRSVVRKGGASVGRASWRASGYRRNPRRRRLRRNPAFGGGVVGEIVQVGQQAVAVMAGGVLGRTVSGMIPIGNGSPYIGAAKGVVIALLLKRFGRKVVSADLADALAVGALIDPLRTLVLTVVPQASQFLSGGPLAFPTFPGGRVGNYPRLGSYESDSDDGQLSSYASSEMM